MLRCGNEMAHATRLLFDGVSSQHGYIPHRIARLGVDVDTLPEDTHKQVTMTTYPLAKHLIQHVEFLQLRSLVLTPQFTLYLRECDKFFSTCATSVVDLTLYSFYDEDALTIGGILEHLGPRLLSFRGDHANRVMVNQVCAHCTSLQKLDLTLSGATDENDFPISSAGNWSCIEQTLTHLTITYRRNCPESDSSLVRNTFRALRELNILFREKNIHPAEYREVAKFFGGVGKHNLERANLGAMPAPLISRIRSFYQSTKLRVQLNSNTMAAQFAAAGENLAIAELSFNFDGAVPLVSDVEEGARNCNKLEEIHIPTSMRKFAVQILQNTSLTSLRLLYLHQSPPKCLDILPGHTGALETLYYSGSCMDTEVFYKIADKNPRIKRVHLMLRFGTVDDPAHVLKAFSNSRELQELTIETPTRCDITRLRSLNCALGRYYIRQAHVRINETALID